ncbi:MAG: HEAT repeat domain-containing protein [Elusimicrobia bacterium]|nr:HEAT repeat domain-containing protein [Elusimicrobiota bacterium]
MGKGMMDRVKFTGLGAVVFLSLLCTLHFALCTVVCSDELMIQQHINGLKHKKSDVRIESARALGESGDPEVVPVLRDALNDKDDDVRLEAVYALSKIRDDAAVAALAVAVRDDEEEVRLAAVDGLSGSESKAAISPLIEATKDKDDNIKRPAVILLGAIGDASVIQPISQLLSDKSDEIRIATVYAIGSIGGIDAVRALSSALDDKRNEVSIAAVRVLGALGYEDAIPLLTAVLKQKRDIVIHKTVAEALVAIGHKSAIPALVEISNKVKGDDKKPFNDAIIKILEKNRGGAPKGKKIKEVKSRSANQSREPRTSEVPSNLSQQEKLKLMRKHYMAGIDFYKKREYEKSASEFKEVLKIDPEHTQSKEMLERINSKIE